MALRKLAQSKRDTVSIETFTITQHHVHVDLTDLLGQYDVTDQVVLLIETPSGRSKRVHINGSFLAAQHHISNEVY